MVAILLPASPIIVKDPSHTEGVRLPPLARPIGVVSYWIIVAPHPHIHHAHEEGFYILEGELEFVVGTQTVRAGQGSFVMVPIGVAHTFSNPMERPVDFPAGRADRRLSRKLA